MTYNNTVWDKLQMTGVKIKKGLVLMAIIGIIVSGISNISRQYSTLIEANKENQTLIKNIEKIEKENKVLVQKIEYATSSAFIEEEARDKLGLGSKNDYWIKMPKNSQNDNWYPYVNVGDSQSILKQWINLFTR